MAAGIFLPWLPLAYSPDPRPAAFQARGRTLGARHPLHHEKSKRYEELAYQWLRINGWNSPRSGSAPRSYLARSLELSLQCLELAQRR